MVESTKEREEALGRLEKLARMVPGVVYQYRLRPDVLPFASSGFAACHRRAEGGLVSLRSSTWSS